MAGHACRTGGVQRFDPATGKFTIFRHSAAAGSLSNDGVTSILADRSGTIWAGTLDGLNRLDAATGKFTVYLERDGLPGNIINGVVEDASGDLWITTSYGLSHFRRRSGTFYNYYRSDGVLDDLTGAWKGSSGQIFFGSYSGLTALSPDAVDEQLLIPRVVLTNFQISDKPVPVGGDSPLKKSISVTKALTLSHSQNTLSFEFTALSYADPERTRYRYRLEGVDSGWNEVASTQHFTRYPNLAPREYFSCRSPSEPRELDGERRHSPPCDSSAVVEHRVVQARLYPGRGIDAVAQLASPPSANRAGIQHAPGRTRGRADAHRPRFA